jgi:hypothetical protein
MFTKKTLKKEKNIRSKDASKKPGGSELPKICEYLKLVDNPGLLNALYLLSKSELGFFPRIGSRAIEYPWVASSVLKTSLLANNKRSETVVELGSGVSPIPLFLHDMGFKVITTDLHTVVRNIDNKHTWNEWGYLDYSQFRPQIKSYNIDFANLDIDDESVDYFISISVVEHMPAENRRKSFHTASQSMRVGGKFIITVDLSPKSFSLWNRNEGKEVEDSNLHGTIDDIRLELETCAIKIDHLDIHRNLPFCGTDIACISGTKISN